MEPLEKEIAYVTVYVTSDETADVTVVTATGGVPREEDRQADRRRPDRSAYRFAQQGGPKL